MHNKTLYRSLFRQIPSIIYHMMFTLHVSSVPLKEEEHEAHDGQLKMKNISSSVVHEVSIGDTVRIRGGYIFG
jgi:cytochrome c-type biogenesis protein CcmF